jgi:pimeloyl-ACP methyl ester carboxylesterase
MGSTSTAVARTPVLEIAYEQAGPADGVPVILMHGFPYDVRSYDEVVAPLVARNARVVAPYLRGFGRRGLTQHRDELCSLLWRTWSPAASPTRS